MRGRGKKQDKIPGEGISRLFEVPKDVATGLPMVELTGNREALVGRCQDVLEYDENIVKLAAGKMTIKFYGRNLQIRSMQAGQAVVEGYFTSIEFNT